MRLSGLIIGLFFIASCSNEQPFNSSDANAIDLIRRDYVNGWLAGDSETVMGLFTEHATITPSGLAPLKGKSAIELYWFPKDSSETIIHSYAVQLIDLQGSDSIAYSLEKGVLNFTYTKGDFTMTKESTSHASTIYKKNKEGNWKIISRMWTSLNQ